MAATTDPVERLRERLDHVRPCSGGFTARCPAHDDHHNSLKVDRADDGHALVHCYAGCLPDEVMHAVGLTLADLYPPAPHLVTPTSHGRIVATYDYVDARAVLCYQAVRYEPKGFAQRRPNGRGGWLWNLGDVERVLYRLIDLLAADPREPVCLCEGEKDADRLASLGFVATTHAGGAGQWRPEYAETLRDRHVVVVEDHDDAGRQRSEKVAASLTGIAHEVRVLVLPGLPEKGDVSDWLDAGGDHAELRRLIAAAPVWSPLPAVTPLLPASTTSDRWPTLSDDALWGLAGDVVRAIAPHTEGDPAALLINFLVMFGSALGTGPHALVGATRHGTNLFAVQVGITSKGRKGTAHDEPLRLVGGADAAWAASRIMGGLSSGEGLIFPIRDPVEAMKKGVLEIVDSGVSDKRLLVVEEEFSSTLKVAGREGNTLTEVIRKAWDGKRLGVMTRNNPLAATSPHVSILGHITKDELLRVLDSTDAANGYANRFLWVCVRRSKLLPEGGGLPIDEAEQLIARIRQALAEARKRAEIRRDGQARALWAEVYGDLSEGKPGLLGAVTSRAEAQVLRLSLLYALLDGAHGVQPEHLIAALAVWDYCEASARFVFGDAVGDPIADRILTALRANGAMAQTEIVDLFGRNVNGARLGRAQEALISAGLARSEQEASGGRPRTIWRAA
jgi:hypothetical protein